MKTLVTESGEGSCLVVRVRYQYSDHILYLAGERIHLKEITRLFVATRTILIVTKDVPHHE